MNKIRCPGCMRIKTSSPVCEHCGYDETTGNAPHQLPVGTVLREQYVIGRVLGQGGFGITYLGWDRYLDIPVAIKEYYPSGVVMRDCSVTAQVSDVTGNSERFRHNRDRFLREAKVLARFSQVPEVVQVKNFFLDNNTAYIVMEYVEGITLKQYVKGSGGKLSAEETLGILKPVMRTLGKVHEAGVVHRDISPDNIMMLPGGGAKLLDFGAVRDVSGAQVGKELTKSTEAILKQGYAPIEQYQKKGALGPWTDIYALCATICYCLTGEVPPDAPARMMDYENLDLGEIPDLTKKQEAALVHGLALRAEDRPRSMEELYQELYGKAPSAVAEPAPKPVGKEPEKKRKYPVIAAAVAAVAVLTAAVLALQPEEAPTVSETRQETEPGAIQIIATGTCGEDLAWTLNAEGELAVSGSGGMEDYSGGTDRPWEDHLAEITNITLEEGVQSVGAEAFRGTGILEVRLPASVSEVGDKAFYNCPNLQRAELTENTVLHYSIREEPIFTRSKNEISGITLAGLSGGMAEDYAAVYGYIFESTGKVDYESRGSCTSSPYNGGDVNWYFDRETKYLRFIGNDYMREITNDIWNRYPKYGSSDTPWKSFREEVENIYIGNGVKNVDHNAFEDFAMLRSIYLPDSVEQVGAHALRATGLEQLRVPRNTWMMLFSAAGCEHLREVVLPLGYPSIDMGTFAGCVNMEKLYTHFHHYTIEGAFGMRENFAFWLPYPDPLSEPEYPKNLTVYVPEITEFDRQFAEKFGMQIALGFEGFQPERMGSCGGNMAWMLEDGVLTISGKFTSMFYRSPDNLDAMAWNGEPRYGNNRTAEEAPWYEWREEIHTVIVKPGIMKLNRGLFCDMPNLKYMDLGTVEAIYTGVIDNCGIETLVLPESLCTIEAGAVVNCKQLKTLVVEGGSDSIGRDAFAGNMALEDIWFPNGEEKLTGNIFASAAPENVTFHVQEGSWAQRYAQNNGYPWVTES